MTDTCVLDITIVLGAFLIISACIGLGYFLGVINRR